MSNDELTTRPGGTLTARRLDAIVKLVVDGLDSPESRRKYAHALTVFLDWYEATGAGQLNKAVVQSYVRELRDSGLSPSTVNLRLAAIRRMVSEAADNELIPDATAARIRSVKGIPQRGQRIGNWLSRDDAQRLLDAPNVRTVKGKRDRALLAVLLGSGLRRDEAARLTLDQIQQRECRWTIVDLAGKHGRVRTVPLPSWAKAAVDQWIAAARITGGPVFRRIGKGQRVTGDPLTGAGVWYIVGQYSESLDLDVAPHDLRRTFAKLAHKGHAPVDQIQLALGHASAQTTERYLGVELNLADAACDRLGLN